MSSIPFKLFLDRVDYKYSSWLILAIIIPLVYCHLSVESAVLFKKKMDKILKQVTDWTSQQTGVQVQKHKQQRQHVEQQKREDNVIHALRVCPVVMDTILNISLCNALTVKGVLCLLLLVT